MQTLYFGSQPHCIACRWPVRHAYYDDDDEQHSNPRCEDCYVNYRRKRDRQDYGTTDDIRDMDEKER